jgi:hypothetical protein
MLLLGMLIQQKHFIIQFKKVIEVFLKSENLLYSRFLKFFYTVLIAVSALPFLTKDLFKIKKALNENVPPLDNYYYQRIFSKDPSIVSLGNFYVDLNDYSYRSTTIFSIGESLQKIFYNLLKQNVLITYYLLSLVYLVIWIILITKLIGPEKNYYLSSVIVTIFIILFLGNSRITNNEYPFARLLSPQFTLMIWLLGLVMIKAICSTKTNFKKSFRYIFFYSVILMLSSFSYLYTFLSLLGSGLILIALLFLEKKYRLSGSLFLLIIFFSLPFFISNFIKSKEIRFNEATERMGMIHWRLPGSITTILLCTMIIMFIVFQSYLNKDRLKIEESKKIILIMSSGLLLASQSNIVTNVEIQFYHFNIYSQICLMIILSLLFRNLITKKYSRIFTQVKVEFSIATLLVIAIFSIGNYMYTIVQNYNYGVYENIYTNHLSRSNNVIIDHARLQYIFPIYSSAKILYQSDIAAYGYSNLELLDRAYTSLGCPLVISNSLKADLTVYRLEAIRQKYITLDKYINFFNLDGFFSDYRNEIFTLSQYKEKEIESQFKDYLSNEKGKNCFQKAKSFNIDTIIFDKNSNWNLILLNKNIKIESIGSNGLMKARI